MAGTPWRATLSTANLLSLEALLRPGKRPTALAARFGRTPRVVGGGNPAHSATKLVQQGGKQLGSMACRRNMPAPGLLCVASSKRLLLCMSQPFVPCSPCSY